MRLYRVSMPEEVWGIIRDNFLPLEAESVDIAEAGGRICAQNIEAPEDVPGFDRSVVDGYAVRADDTFGAGESLPAMLVLTGEVQMGQAAPVLLPGNCIYVPTGGMMPAGADAVVRLEDTEVLGNLVNCYSQVAPGDNIIRRGEDITEKMVIIQRGKKLRAVEMGLLASLGLTRVKVTKKPSMGIFSTGDEIVPYTAKKLEPGQVRDSNALVVSEVARRRGAEVVWGGILPDSLLDFRQGVEDMLKKVDFLVLSGGSSVGTRDYTAQTLQELGGGSLLVEGIAIQPGKPTLLAKCQGKPVLGLPGHPVSALNIFTLFGVRIIDSLSGLTDEGFTASVRAVLTRNIASRPGRTDYVRVRLEKKGTLVEATPVLGRSGLLRTMADAHGVTVVPPGSEGLLAGTAVEVFLIDS